MFLNALPGQACSLQVPVWSGAPWHPGSPSFPPSQDLNLRRPVEIFPPHVTGQPVQSPHSVHSEQIFDFWWIGYNFIIKYWWKRSIQHLIILISWNFFITYNFIAFKVLPGTGQVCSLQTTVSISPPIMQPTSPALPFSQSRYRKLFPPPHVASQPAKSDHWPQTKHFYNNEPFIILAICQLTGLKK